MSLFSQRIGIDLGTANSLVWVEGKGIVLNEPTVVAISVDDQRVVAVGNEAKEMLGRTPGNITALRPMRDGVIADYVVTEAMLRYFIQRVGGRAFFFKPEVMICVPAGCTQVERRAVLDATLSAGARTAYLIDEPLAAAIGANIPIAEASGNMVVDIGGGAAEAAVISLGGVVVHHSARVGGNKIDEAIAAYVRRAHNLVIGDQTAEMIKIKIGSALRQAQGKLGEKEETLEVKGRDFVEGLPRSVKLTSTEITEAIQKPLEAILAAVKAVLEEVPPELSSDIIDKGIVMTGGTSTLRNFDRYLTEKTGVPCHVAEDAILCVARGTGVALENLDLYKRSVTKR
ncbi:MAG: rod shape-determining protein [Candidatus Chisholmbacteria bacterium]|nr:rod shape-determining protein [Candidatus Chisholmbacteria bacterium]